MTDADDSTGRARRLLSLGYLPVQSQFMNQDEENRRRSEVAQAAYFKAEHEGFPPGQALRHWLEAELDLFPEDHIHVPESLEEG